MRECIRSTRKSKAAMLRTTTEYIIAGVIRSVSGTRSGDSPVPVTRYESKLEQGLIESFLFILLALAIRL